MKAFDTWLNKNFEKALENPERFVRQQKINKVLTTIGLLIVTIVTLSILNIF